MPDPLDGLTPAQREVAAHRGGPLLVVGAAGTGKTRALLARHAWLASAGGLAPEQVLALTASEAAADALRTGVEDELERGFEELAVHTVHGFGARLLRDEALEAGLDPFVVPVAPADRLAMLLERVDELTLQVHDFQGNPATLLASVIARIDRLKEAMVTADEVARWAAALPQGDQRAEREREFAGLYETHDRMLREQGALDFGDLLLRAVALLRDKPHVRARVSARWRHVLVDDAQDLELAALRLVAALGSEHGGLTAAGDDDCAVRRGRGAAPGNLRDLATALPGAHTVRLQRSLRAPAAILQAAQAVVEPIEGRIEKAADAPPGGGVRFWRCANERAQAQGTAAEIERLVRSGVAPEEIGVLVRSVRNEGQAIAVALEERAVPYGLAGATAFFQRAEVKDVLAWLRLLVDPGDAGAVVRALARPPIELRAIDIARSVQIARRRKLDMVGALVAATESPQLPPEARERILGFLKLHRSAAGALDTARPDLFVHRLIDRLGLRRQQLFAAQADVVERLVSLARLGDLATAYVRRAPQATGRDFARYVSAVAEAGLHDDEEEGAGEGRHGAVCVLAMHAAQGREFRHVFVLGLQSARMPGRAPARGRADPRRAAARGARRRHARRARQRHAPAAARRDDPRARGARPRLRRALGRRRPAAPLALPGGGARRAAGAVGGARRGALRPRRDAARHLHHAARRAAALDPAHRRAPGRAAPGHRPRRRPRRRALPRAGQAGRAHRSAGRPVGGRRPAGHQHRAARRGHRPAARDPADQLAGRDAARRRARRPRPRGRDRGARGALAGGLPAHPRRRAAAQRLRHRDLPHVPAEVQVRARVPDPERADPQPALRDPRPPGARALPPERRVARSTRCSGCWRPAGGAAASAPPTRSASCTPRPTAPCAATTTASATRTPSRCGSRRPSASAWARTPCAGAWTASTACPTATTSSSTTRPAGPRSAAQLREDVQLSLYAVGAREAWGLESSQQSYLYVLDDAKVPLPVEEVDRDWITETVFEVADGILAQGFEPTPSYAACSICDYRIACPAAER